MARKRFVPGAATPAVARLFAAARASDPDPWRNGLREALASGDREALARLAGDPGLAARPVASLVLLAGALTATGQTGQAIDALRHAQRQYPDNFPIAESLGWALWMASRPAEAVPFATAAVALAPRSGMSRAILGIALAETGRLEAAEFEFREAIRLQPDYPNIHSHYGYALFQAARYDEAALEVREAVRLKPDWGAARRFLGVILQILGRDGEAEIEFRKAIELCRASIRSYGRNASVNFDLDSSLRGLGLALMGREKFDEATAALLDSVEECRERFGPADPRTARARALLRLPALLKRADQPRDATERVLLAGMDYRKKWFAASARLYGEAFAADAKLADALDARHRYNAACSAALAGIGAGKDEPGPDDAAKARLRRQALDWLEADLAASSARLTTDPRSGPKVAAVFRHWKVDTDLAGVHDPRALDNLPAEERKTWRTFWSEVDAILKKAEAAQP
jgi:Flp pilus assembly protein TadD